MPLILLIRHGENDYVKKGKLAGYTPGVHLNETGRNQAQKIVELLKDAPVKAVYSSPLERAMETAQPLAQAIGQEVLIREGLIETNVGEWTGKSIKSLARQKIWRVVQTAPSLMRFPGGESFAEGQRRICAELEIIAAAHDPKDVVACFSHADPIRLAIAFYIGQPLDMFQRLTVAPGSITALWLAEGAARLLNLNYDPGFSLPKA
jgi:probable phosphoglycerate mutase